MFFFFKFLKLLSKKFLTHFSPNNTNHPGRTPMEPANIDRNMIDDLIDVELTQYVEG